ncbi:MerR family transcriptional regulator [Lampropedia aestuarii]|uniref:MerR family transcriptional regulator n=1 Tax=Lampropedia aestuarii TaxID=2562762 RepID=A0A4S5BJF9_9BURK|nr:MerR family transcriptional regulator [Lampropedia aestuarii]THJ32470.1 MerR family transcriptional regulator [Lampropedia aestuarii]
MNTPLPPIPAKRYFTIGEVAELCDVKPHVLRYWEQEFTQLRPMKRRGNRRYYQHHEVLMIRRIRELLYGQGFTISGARTRLQSWSAADAEAAANSTVAESNSAPAATAADRVTDRPNAQHSAAQAHEKPMLADEATQSAQQHEFSSELNIRHELIQIRDFLSQATSKYGL